MYLLLYGMTVFSSVRAVTADRDSVADTVGTVFSLVTAATADTDGVADTVRTDCLWYSNSCNSGQ